MSAVICIHQLNKSVTKDWDCFTSKYGDSWDALSEATKEVAVKLSEVQSNHMIQKFTKNNYVLETNGTKLFLVPK